MSSGVPMGPVTSHDSRHRSKPRCCGSSTTVIPLSNDRNGISRNADHACSAAGLQFRGGITVRSDDTVKVKLGLCSCVYVCGESLDQRKPVYFGKSRHPRQLESSVRLRERLSGGRHRGNFNSETGGHQSMMTVRFQHKIRDPKCGVLESRILPLAQVFLRERLASRFSGKVRLPGGSGVNASIECDV